MTVAVLVPAVAAPLLLPPSIDPGDYKLLIIFHRKDWLGFWGKGPVDTGGVGE